MEDKILGHLLFKVGWVKNEIFDILGTKSEIRVRTSSYKNDVPTEVQRQSYLAFKNNLNSLNKKVLPMVNDFIKSYMDDIREIVGLDNVENIHLVIDPKELLLFKSGKYALIFDTVWSEEGMAILVNGNDVLVDESSILEFEL